MHGTSSHAMGPEWNRDGQHSSSGNEEEQQQQQLIYNGNCHDSSVKHEPSIEIIDEEAIIDDGDNVSPLNSVVHNWLESFQHETEISLRRIKEKSGWPFDEDLRSYLLQLLTARLVRDRHQLRFPFLH